MTFVLKQKTWSLYYDKSLVSRLELGGRYLSNEGDLFIGGFFNEVCVPGVGLDNVQVFSQPLT